MSNGSESRPNIILVLADSMRARNVSCYGYPHETTPNLDAMAARGMRFQNAFTVAPFTVASVTSILTGVYPSVHRLERYGQCLSDDLVTLPEILQAAGYYTAGFVANPHINPDAGLTRGFDYFTDGRPAYKRPRPMSRITAWAESGKALNRRVKAQLRKMDDTDHPYFFLVFYNDSHVPFSGLPRILLPLVGMKFHTPDFERIFYTDGELARVQDLYDQALQRADRCLGQLLESIRQATRSDNTVVIFSADHGEGLDRRFERAGHGRLYDNGIHVPLVVAASSISVQGQVVEDVVTTLDIAPTICDLAGVNKPQQFQGRSLSALMSGQSLPHVDSRVISEYHDSRAVRTSDWKLIHRGNGIAGARAAYGTAVELYHLAHDPGEDFNVADVHPVLRDRFLDELREFEAAVDESSLVPATFQRDNLTLERLRGLGYIE